MDQYATYFEANRELWNKRTAVHKDSSFYDVAGFKAGDEVLTPIELNELGEVNGKSMLHLQCHFGMDSLSWARKGVKVTGVDLSEDAIAEARKLAKELKLNAEFVACNVYDLHPASFSAAKPSPLGPAPLPLYDIVFTSYGVVGWLPDLTKWAEIIACYLKPGGLFYMAEFHPVVWMFDDEFTTIKYYYENRELIVMDSEGTYTDRNADIKAKEYSWNHSISEVLNALIAAGLQVELFNEHMYSPYPCFQNISEFEPGKWHVNGMEGKIPMVYSLKARKPLSK